MHRCTKKPLPLKIGPAFKHNYKQWAFYGSNLPGTWVEYINYRDDAGWHEIDLGPEQPAHYKH